MEEKENLPPNGKASFLETRDLLRHPITREDFGQPGHDGDANYVTWLAAGRAKQMPAASENLPPLPEPWLTHDRDLRPLLVGPCFHADQMREFGALCARMAREEAAKVCEGLIPEMEDGVREDSYAATALRCAAAIRKG